MLKTLRHLISNGCILTYFILKMNFMAKYGLASFRSLLFNKRVKDKI